MEPFVVSINPSGQQAYRSFWRGPLGTAALLAPGVVITVVGVVLGARDFSGVSIFFAAVIVFSGLYAVYAGWDHRRRSLQVPDESPLAFVLDEEGAHFPRHKHYPWSEVRFVLTDEESPRLLCSPVGLAYRMDRLDRSPDELGRVLPGLSDGAVRLERD